MARGGDKESALLRWCETGGRLSPGKLQQGEKLSMPQSRPMPQIGRRCHELRIRDKQAIWRIIYRIDSDAIIILDVFAKKSRETPKHIVKACKGRLRRYDSIVQGD